MIRVLFVGGPWDGKYKQVDAKFPITVPEKLQRPVIEMDAGIPAIDRFKAVMYHLEKITMGDESLWFARKTGMSLPEAMCQIWDGYRQNA